MSYRRDSPTLAQGIPDEPWSEFAGLPPKPDPQTGEPFPPRGLAYGGGDRKPEHDRGRQTRLSHKPKPPPSKGPVLAWHKESRRGKFWWFIFWFLFLAAGATVLGVFEGRPPLGWMQFWFLWVILIVGALLLTQPLTYKCWSAGSDWVQLEHCRFGRIYRWQWVDLYELRAVTAHARPAYLNLELRDYKGSISQPHSDWQSDRRIWDLVYNGIIHSVAAGAETNRNSRGMLRLDDLEIELRFPHGARVIDVAGLSDSQILELLEDPVLQRLPEHIGTAISVERFREWYPEISEDMLANPAKPEWFPPEPQVVKPGVYREWDGEYSSSEAEGAGPETEPVESGDGRRWESPGESGQGGAHRG